MRIPWSQKFLTQEVYCAIEGLWMNITLVAWLVRAEVIVKITTIVLISVRSCVKATAQSRTYFDGRSPVLI